MRYALLVSEGMRRFDKNVDESVILGELLTLCGQPKPVEVEHVGKSSKVTLRFEPVNGHRNGVIHAKYVRFEENKSYARNRKNSG